MAEQSKPYEPTPFEEGCEKLFQQRKRDRAAGKIQEASRHIVIGHEEAIPLEQRGELDEAAKAAKGAKGAKSFAGYPGRCKTCGAVVKKSATKESGDDGLTADMQARGWVKVPVSDSRRPPRKTVDIDRAKLALKESFIAIGLDEKTAAIAAGLDEGTFAGVPIRDLLKG